MGQVETISLLPSSTTKRQAQLIEGGEEQGLGVLSPPGFFHSKQRRGFPVWIKELGQVWLGTPLLG